MSKLKATLKRKGWTLTPIYKGGFPFPDGFLATKGRKAICYLGKPVRAIIT